MLSTYNCKLYERGHARERQIASFTLVAEPVTVVEEEEEYVLKEGGKERQTLFVKVRDFLDPCWSKVRERRSPSVAEELARSTSDDFAALSQKSSKPLLEQKVYDLECLDGGRTLSGVRPQPHLATFPTLPEVVESRIALTALPVLNQ